MGFGAWFSGNNKQRNARNGKKATLRQTHTRQIREMVRITKKTYQHATYMLLLLLLCVAKDERKRDVELADNGSRAHHVHSIISLTMARYCLFDYEAEICNSPRKQTFTVVSIHSGCVVVLRKCFFVPYHSAHGSYIRWCRCMLFYIFALDFTY